MAFTEKQKIMVYESAIALKQALIVDSDPLAKEFLAGKLGSILDAVINKTYRYQFPIYLILS
ncbi:hypothetical protein WD347_004493 [Vibrio parahaemolyticus]|uniref:hypothetical protein n=1 Tax=Vibrio parahaemolyticus TaxID=670 RepID=UPI00038E738A|nr:hypothetical protein [Vibrio parahaemolyticus]EJG0923751.1 hypothetical protein [Vibrio parahaemolyticus O1:K68]EJG0933417.1 hypothetical protein [Vibrio parahaemolyticus O1]EJG0947525.1 hypothetical protein [Vibrio parahaemolyticus O10]EQM49596.1 hypothetical protein D051_4044 [Vibrio parahaemolyticus VPCR-2010]EGQ9104600.1 hypothetical protein [Vibrio parahaemolyticus]